MFKSEIEITLAFHIESMSQNYIIALFIDIKCVQDVLKDGLEIHKAIRRRKGELFLNN